MQISLWIFITGSTGIEAVFIIQFTHAQNAHNAQHERKTEYQESNQHKKRLGKLVTPVFCTHANNNVGDSILYLNSDVTSTTLQWTKKINK